MSHHRPQTVKILQQLRMQPLNGQAQHRRTLETARFWATSEELRGQPAPTRSATRVHLGAVLGTECWIPQHEVEQSRGAALDAALRSMRALVAHELYGEIREELQRLHLAFWQEFGDHRQAHEIGDHIDGLLSMIDPRD